MPASARQRSTTAIAADASSTVRSSRRVSFSIRSGNMISTVLTTATVRLKPDTTYRTVRLKPDTTYRTVRLKPDTTYRTVRLKPDTTYGDDYALKRFSTKFRRMRRPSAVRIDSG